MKVYFAILGAFFGMVAGFWFEAPAKSISSDTYTSTGAGLLVGGALGWLFGRWLKSRTGKS
ncbi:MAG TPA: hypothetical protein VD887_07920 [Allosphingosinicella sp.]|nr:hypothetical protein [Allosphingosinicella sp.]